MIDQPEQQTARQRTAEMEAKHHDRIAARNWANVHSSADAQFPGLYQPSRISRLVSRLRGVGR